jgi:hypothetical protein
MTKNKIIFQDAFLRSSGQSSTLNRGAEFASEPPVDIYQNTVVAVVFIDMDI